jgi:hypothetical protein
MSRPARHLETIHMVVQGGQGIDQTRADFGTIHMKLILQAYRMQELWNHGAFQDFKGKSERLGSTCSECQTWCFRI